MVSNDDLPGFRAGRERGRPVRKGHAELRKGQASLGKSQVSLERSGPDGLKPGQAGKKSGQVVRTDFFGLGLVFRIRIGFCWIRTGFLD